ncbi:MAG: hypothetical protein LC785_06435 [Acidobacteria bacterium]|nr:hypothetical protein [Acidobacteriota bacterium]MCA1641579.1 hypothetical protein [Acidobacteriota bacterium]
MSDGIGDALREGFEMMLEVTGQTIIVHSNFNSADVSSFEARGLKNTASKSSSKVVFQFLEALDIKVGDVLQIKGGRDYWRATDTEDIIKDDTFIHFEVHVEKINVAGQPTRPYQSSGTNYYLHGEHARVNINSQDQSINLSVRSVENVFSNLRQAISNQVQNVEERTVLLHQLQELEQAKGTTTFTDKYRDFMSFAADHIGVIAPFIPALSQLLGGN